ncbi:MAG: Mor transcription activator family protein [Rhodoferax sp.]
MVKNQKSPATQLSIDEAVIFETNQNDIIDDILRRVIALAPGFSAALAAQVDKEVREQWGGDRPYIGVRRGAGSSARNESIKRDYWQNGEHIPLLERRYGLKARQLWYIIKS